MKRCVIITAGPIGDCAPLKGLVKPGDYVICADGGARHLEALGVTPDIIMGDMDSAGALPENIKALRYKCEKDETDTMLAVMHGLDHGYRDFLLLGGLKGRLDHTFANLSTLLYIIRHGAHGRIMDADNEAVMIENGELRLKKREGVYISVFPFAGDAFSVTEKGFKYGLDNAEMHADFPSGVSNEFLADEGVITVKNGALLIIISKEN